MFNKETHPYFKKHQDHILHVMNIATVTQTNHNNKLMTGMSEVRDATLGSYPQCGQ